MQWTRQMVDVLQAKWQSGESTSSIARSCTATFHVEVSKNAVVGKAHRMARTEPGWDARPSPIKHTKDAKAEPARTRQDTLPPLQSQKPAPRSARLCASTLPAPAMRNPTCLGAAADRFLAFRAPVIAAPPPPKPPAPEIIFPRPRCEARDPNMPLRRRDGTGCLFPIGNPGARNFRYCDAGLTCLSKPYCEEHTKLTTVVSRTSRRKDVVAVGSYDED